MRTKKRLSALYKVYKTIEREVEKLADEFRAIENFKDTYEHSLILGAQENIEAYIIDERKGYTKYFTNPVGYEDLPMSSITTTTKQDIFYLQCIQTIQNGKIAIYINLPSSQKISRIIEKQKDEKKHL